MKVERGGKCSETPLVAGGVYTPIQRTDWFYVLSRSRDGWRFVDTEDGQLFDPISEDTIRREFRHVPNARLVIEE